MMAYQNTNITYLNTQHKSGKTFSSNKFSLFKKNKNILMTKNWTYSLNPYKDIQKTWAIDQPASVSCRCAMPSYTVTLCLLSLPCL